MGLKNQIIREAIVLKLTPRRIYGITQAVPRIQQQRPAGIFLPQHQFPSRATQYSIFGTDHRVVHYSIMCLNHLHTRLASIFMQRIPYLNTFPLNPMRSLPTRMRPSIEPLTSISILFPVL